MDLAIERGPFHLAEFAFRPPHFSEPSPPTDLSFLAAYHFAFREIFMTILTHPNPISISLFRYLATESPAITGSEIVGRNRVEIEIRVHSVSQKERSDVRRIARRGAPASSPIALLSRIPDRRVTVAARRWPAIPRTARATFQQLSKQRSLSRSVDPTPASICRLALIQLPRRQLPRWYTCGRFIASTVIRVQRSSPLSRSLSARSLSVRADTTAVPRSKLARCSPSHDDSTETEENSSSLAPTFRLPAFRHWEQFGLTH